MSNSRKETTRLANAKKALVSIIVVSVLIAMLSFVIIACLNLRDSENQKQIIICDLSGKTYSNLPYERGTPYYTVWSDYVFNTGSQTVNVQANGNDYSLDYFPRLSPFGLKYVVVTTNTGQKQEFRLIYAGDTVVQICPQGEDTDCYYWAGFGRLKGNTISESREGKVSASFKVWLAIIITGCCAIIVALIHYAIVDSAYKKITKQKEENERAFVARQNKEAVISMWTRYVRGIITKTTELNLLAKSFGLIIMNYIYLRIVITIAFDI